MKLLHAYRVWAKQRQAVEIQVHVTHGFNLKKIHRFFKKLGFQMVGANYRHGDIGKRNYKMMKVGQHNPMAGGLVGVNSVWSGVGCVRCS